MIFYEIGFRILVPPNIAVRSVLVSSVNVLFTLENYYEQLESKPYSSSDSLIKKMAKVTYFVGLVIFIHIVVEGEFQ